MSGSSDARQEVGLWDLCRPFAEASPNAIAAVEGPSNIVRYVNPAFCLLAGRPAKELVGLAFSDVVPADDEFLSLFERVYRTGQSETYSGQPQSAPLPFYTCSLSPLLSADDRALGILVHVAESKPAHEQGVATNQALMVSSLRQHELVDATEALNAKLQSEIIQRERSEGRLRALLESASEGIIAIDEEGTILLVNAMSEQLFGYSSGELLGQPVEILLRNDVRGVHSSHRPTYFAHPHSRLMGAGMSLAGQRKDGSTFPVEINLSSIQEGESQVVLALVNDITQRKLVEDQLRESAKLESLGVLAGGIAHDFNNLLTGVLGYASMAIDQLPAGSSGREMIGEVIRSAERAAHLTNQMLAYSGKGKFIVQPVNLSEFTRDIVMLVRSSIPRTAKVDLQLVEELPLVEADVAQLQQLVMNLFINAGEAIGDTPGVVTIRTGVREVHDGQSRAGPRDREVTPGRYIFLEVEDTGSGMDEVTRQRIFDPFFTTKFTGRGLGLSAVLGIVRGHGGAIEVESTPGRGSKFTVLLPETTLQKRTAPHYERASKVASGTILIIDDEESIRRMARLILETAGYRVIVAGDGEQAVEMFRKGANHIAAVVLDMTMPVMSGAETLKHLRKLKPDVPIALSSGFTELEALARFPAKSVEAFVQKPYTAAVLLETVNRIVAESGNSNTAQE